MSFLTPLFLAGLLGLAVPILLHLRRSDRNQVLAFPSLMFLRKIPHSSVRRRRIRHLLLLLLRCAALTLLVLAFARPLVEGSLEGGSRLEGGRELVILLDQSYSMGYGDRWQRALGAAREAVAALGAEDRATLVLFSERAEARNQPTGDQARLRAILDSARLSSRGTNLAPALKLARRLLLDSKLPRRAVVLISDFQKLGWSGDDDIRLPRGTALNYTDLSDLRSSNLSVASVLLGRGRAGGRERVVVSGRVTNRGEEPFEEVSVALEINQRAQQVKKVSLAPNSSTTVSFDPLTVSEGTSLGSVRAVADLLEKDNAFHFVLSPANLLSVLIVEGSGRRRADSLYLERTLQLGDRPGFRVATRPASGVSAADLERMSVVIVNDAQVPADLLLPFLEKGGGVLVALGRGGTGGNRAGHGLHPLPSTAPVDRASDWGGRLSHLDFSHPVFEVFSALTRCRWPMTSSRCWHDSTTAPRP
jgi:hypothetical protein